MKNMIWNNQNGFSLPLTLVVFAIGFLAITPLVIGLSTTLISSKNSRVSTYEQNAIDAAYEDALWDLKYGTLAESLTEPCDSTNYTLQEAVNNLRPTVTVTRTSDCGGDDGLDSTIYLISIKAGSSSLDREYIEGAVAPPPTPTATPILVVEDTSDPTPRERKESVVEYLSPYVADSKKYGKRFKKAVEETEKSLDVKYWGTKPGNSGNNKHVIDPDRLDLKKGKDDFKLEEKAVKELKELLKGFVDDKCGGVTSITLEYIGPGAVTVEAFLDDTPMGTFTVEAEDPELESTLDSTFEILATPETDGKLDKEIRLFIDGKEVAKIDTSCSKPIEIGDVHGDFIIDDLEKLPSTDKDKLQVSEESLEFARMAIEDLLTADRHLAQLFLEENLGLVANNPEKQEKVDKELLKAAEELAKGDAEWAKMDYDDPKKLKPDKVIKKYKKAWEKTAKAVKEAAKN